MMVVAVILSLISAAAYLTSADTRFAGRQASKSDVLTAADAALEYAYSQWKTSTAAVIHGNKTSIPPASTWSATSMLSNFNAAYGAGGTFAASTGVTVTALSILATDQNGQPLIDPSSKKDISSTTTPPEVDTNNVPGYPGWSGKSYNYLATATVTSNGHYAVGTSTSGGVTTSDNAVTVKRYFQVTTVPLFQAAIFYENNLEIHPGAKMVVTGLVHTNANFYALGMAAQVQFMNNVSYVGSYSEGSNPAVRWGWDGSNTNGSNTPENVNALYNYYYHTGLYPDLWSDGLPTGTSTTRASQVNQVSTIDPFGGANQSNNGLHDIVEVPATGAAYSDQVAYNNASLRITIDNTGTTDATRYTITDGSNKPLTGVDLTNVLNALKATPTTSMVDQREGTSVVVTSLDMAKLAYATVPTASLNSGGEFGTANNFPVGLNSDGTIYGSPLSPGTTFQKNFQGTVYIRYADHGTPSSTANMAVRLVNGRSLGQDVSVASENGMYIQGDYNTGGTKASDVPTNGTGTTPEASNYTRHSSSVMADAVTILSNSWSDTNAGFLALRADRHRDHRQHGHPRRRRSFQRRRCQRPQRQRDRVRRRAQLPPLPGRLGSAERRQHVHQLHLHRFAGRKPSTARSSPGVGRPTTSTSGPTASGASTRFSCRNSRRAYRPASSSRAAVTSGRSTESAAVPSSP